MGFSFNRGGQDGVKRTAYAQGGVVHAQFFTPSLPTYPSHLLYSVFKIENYPGYYGGYATNTYAYTISLDLPDTYWVDGFHVGIDEVTGDFSLDFTVSGESYDFPLNRATAWAVPVLLDAPGYGLSMSLQFNNTEPLAYYGPIKFNEVLTSGGNNIKWPPYLEGRSVIPDIDRRG